MSRTDGNIIDITKDNVFACRCCVACEYRLYNGCNPKNFICCYKFLTHFMKQARRNHKLYRLHGDNIIIEIKRDSNEINE